MEVDSSGFERLLRSTVYSSRGEDARFVSLVGVREERHGPLRLIAEVSEPTKMDRNCAQTLKVFLSRLAVALRVKPARDDRLRVGIDIAQRSAKANVDSSVPTRIVLLSIGKNTGTRPFLDRWWDRTSTSMGIVDPGLPHGQILVRTAQRRAQPRVFRVGLKQRVRPKFRMPPFLRPTVGELACSAQLVLAGVATRKKGIIVGLLASGARI